MGVIVGVGVTVGEGVIVGVVELVRVTVWVGVAVKVGVGEDVAEDVKVGAGVCVFSGIAVIVFVGDGGLCTSVIRVSVDGSVAVGTAFTVEQDIEIKMNRVKDKNRPELIFLCIRNNSFKDLGNKYNEFLFSHLRILRL